MKEKNEFKCINCGTEFDITLMLQTSDDIYCPICKSLAFKRVKDDKNTRENNKIYQ